MTEPLGGVTGVTTYCAGLVQDFLCGRAPVPPAGFWCALFDADAELALTGYARQSVTFARATTGREASQQTTNFGPAADVEWTVTQVQIFDTATNGHVLFVFTPDEALLVPIGEMLTLDMGALTFGFASIS